MAAEPTFESSPAPGLPAPENLREAEPVRPADYRALNGLYLLLLGGLVTAAHHRDVESPSGGELLTIGAATFAVSKTIAKEKIGTWVREPFVEEQWGHPQPRGGRLRHAVGELVTCTRCVGAWSALSLFGLRVASPQAGRVVTSVLATAALNDFLQAGFRALCAHANAAGSADPAA